MKLSATIPFAGFYESVHDDQIAQEIQSMFDRDGDGDLDIPEDKVNDFWSDLDIGKWGIYTAYVKEYVSFVSDQIGFPLEFEEMVSPREYNFTTDRIFAKIEASDVQKMYDGVDKDKLAIAIKESFTSRSGFSSFYSNSLEEWNEKPLLDWDHNEIGTLLAVYLEQEREDPQTPLALSFIESVDGQWYFIADLIPEEFYKKYDTVTE